MSRCLAIQENDAWSDLVERGLRLVGPRDEDLKNRSHVLAQAEMAFGWACGREPGICRKEAGLYGAALCCRDLDQGADSEGVEGVLGQGHLEPGVLLGTRRSQQHRWLFVVDDEHIEVAIPIKVERRQGTAHRAAGELRRAAGILEDGVTQIPPNAAVFFLEAVGVEEIGQPAGASDPGDEDDLVALVVEFLKRLVQAGNCTARARASFDNTTASISSKMRVALFSGCCSVSPSELT